MNTAQQTRLTRRLLCSPAPGSVPLWWCVGKGKGEKGENLVRTRWKGQQLSEIGSLYEQAAEPYKAPLPELEKQCGTIIFDNCEKNASPFYYRKAVALSRAECAESVRSCGRIRAAYGTESSHNMDLMKNCKA